MSMVKDMEVTAQYIQRERTAINSPARKGNSPPTLNEEKLEEQNENLSKICQSALKKYIFKIMIIAANVHPCSGQI